MKIVTSEEMARIEKMAYSAAFSEETFMEKAGEGVSIAAKRLIGTLHLKPKILLVCGSGNNAGDAYVAGRYLLEADFFEVNAISLAPLEKTSRLTQEQWKRFCQAGGSVTILKPSEKIDFKDVELLIDGIFGTGFKGKVEEVFKEAIEQMNASRLPTLSIDIASGINGTTGEIGEVAVIATETLFLGLPKTGSFLGNAWNYTGKVSVFDFGLPKESVAAAKADFFLIERAEITEEFPFIKRNRHKYEAGYVLGIGGTLSGAASLASYAALRSGAGLVRLFYPKEKSAEFANLPPEIIREGFENEKDILQHLDKANALFLGPGLGTSEKMKQLLSALLPNIKKPCVIDAEALTLIGKEKFPLPSSAILTPHHGEMKRLLDADKEIALSELHKRCQSYVDEKKVTLVLKGAPTIIFYPEKTPLLCSYGDPGMATAGSGDVLTGIIAAFLSQNCDPLRAAKLGVMLHALAGERAAAEFNSYSLVASDITNKLPFIFKEFAKGICKYSRFNFK